MLYLLLLPVIVAVVFFAIGLALFALVPSLKQRVPWRPFAGFLSARFWRTGSLARNLLAVLVVLAVVELAVIGPVPGRTPLTLQVLAAVAALVLPVFVAWEWLYENADASRRGRMGFVPLLGVSVLVWAATLAAGTLLA